MQFVRFRNIEKHVNSCMQQCEYLSLKPQNDNQDKESSKK